MDWTQMIDFIRPELLVLIPVLYLTGAGMKAAAWIADRYIPLILGALGILMSLLYLAATSGIAGRQQMLLYLFSGLTQGILTAGGSVYANQIYRQATKDD